MTRVLPLLVLCGCGRVGFSSVADSNTDVDAGITPVPFTLPTGAGLVRAADAFQDGSVAIVGQVSETVQLGDYTLVNEGSNDVLFAVVGADGGVRWARSFGSAGEERAFAVTTTADNVIYIGGENEGMLDLGSGPFTAMGQDGFVASFTSEGVLRWARAITGDRPSGANGTDQVRTLAPCENGDVIVGGRVAGVVDFGLGPTPAGGTFDAFVARLSAVDGTTKWVKRWGLTAYTRVIGLTTGPGDMIYATGEFEGTIDFGVSSITDDGIQDAFVVALDGDGNYRWATKYGGTSFDWGYSVAVLGDVVASGGFYSNDPFVSGVPPAVGSRDAILIGYDAQTGMQRWTRSFGDATCDVVLAVHQTEDAFVAGGIFTGTVDVGTGPLTSVGTDSVLFGVDVAGATTWTTTITGVGVESLLGITGSRSQGLYLVGGTEVSLSSCSESSGQGYLQRMNLP